MQKSSLIFVRRTLRWIGIGCLLLCSLFTPIALGEDQKRAARKDQASEGAELFLKEWIPGEPSRHGGDGLGPVYNDTSCVACHNLGGVGGAGPKSKNVHLLSSSVTPTTIGGPGDIVAGSRARRREFQASIAKREGRDLPKPRAEGEAVDRKPLIELHSGFEESSTVMIHRYGPEADYEVWRLRTLDPDRSQSLSSRFGGEGRIFQQSARATVFSIPFEYGHFTLTQAELNPAPLFGTGLIDSIPDAAIEAASKGRVDGFYWVRGRVSRLSDGRIGRYGWKAQAATLDGFVLTACAVELGLEVPGQSQAANPRVPSNKKPGLDLTGSECKALAKFVRDLPAPIERIPSNRDEASIVTKGRATFERVGCAACHLPKLGGVEGLYSDLLLHDMGSALSDTGSYSLVSTSSEENGGTLPGMMPNGPQAFLDAVPPVKGPARSEWRTPPLWGVRDSGPYLHDGRAETLEQAIAFHDGEAKAITASYFKLVAGERQAVLRFLKSLEAPAPKVIHEEEGREAPDFREPIGNVGLR